MNHCEECNDVRTIINTATGELEEPTCRAPGNYDADRVSFETGTECKDPSLTNQSDAKDADINEIVRRFGLTGQLQVIQRPPSIEEFGEIFDMQDAMNLVARANQAFMQLPAEARERFGHSPHKFVNFVDDMLYSEDKELRARRLAELRELNLAPPATPIAAPEPPPAATAAPAKT